VNIDPMLVVASLGIGIIVGLTGMGGGALMTPVLVLFFNVPPLTAVSSDLVASAVMKPVGSFVHLRRGTVHLGLVKWLCVGSIPGAFSGVLIARSLGQGQQIEDIIRTALGVALLLAAAGLIVRAYFRLLEHARRRDGRAAPLPQGRPTLNLRPVPTVAVGLIGGIVVGMTSVGSGSLIIIALMALYPTLKASELVGTDLVQAVPLVASAALSHIIFGQFKMDLTASLLVGSIPGVWIGAHLSSRSPGGLVRRMLAFVLLASGLKLLNVSNAAAGITLLLVLVFAPILWMMVRRRHGFPALAGRG
jgi:uncharacterized membrane protein YfcA